MVEFVKYYIFVVFIVAAVRASYSWNEIHWYLLQAITFHFHKHKNDSLCYSKMVRSNVNIFMMMLCIRMMIDTLLKNIPQLHWHNSAKNKNKIFKSIFCSSFFFSLHSTKYSLPHHEWFSGIVKRSCHSFVNMSIKKSSYLAFENLFSFSNVYLSRLFLNRLVWKTISIFKILCPQKNKKHHFCDRNGNYYISIFILIRILILIQGSFSYSIHFVFF